MMEAVVTTGAISSAKFQSNCHRQQTNTHIFTDRMPFLSRNQQCQNSSLIVLLILFRDYASSWKGPKVRNTEHLKQLYSRLLCLLASSQCLDPVGLGDRKGIWPIKRFIPAIPKVSSSEELWGPSPTWSNLWQN